MTVATQELVVQRPNPATALQDALAVAWRYLIAYTRVPQLVVFSTIQPVIFVLMFRYVFGGAIRTPGVSYVEYLMPGIFVQTVTFGAVGTAIGLSTDMKSGLLERFHSLPMARSALLAGRTFADFARNVFVAVLMTIVGVAVGFRFSSGIVPFLAGMGLVLLFGYAMSWIFATVGLVVGDPETAQAAAFPVMAPLVFASSAFVPVSTMPGWLQAFAAHQPVSVTANAMRALIIGKQESLHLLQHTAGYFMWQVVVWAIAILAVFGPMAVRRYRRAV